MEWVTPPFKKDRHPYRLQREFQFLEREQKVTKILSSGAFRSELENILQGHIDGSRRPPKLSKAIQQLQENVVPASRIESSSRTSPRYGAVIGRTYAAIQGVIPINDLRGASASKYTVAARQQRCKLVALYRLVDMFGWAQLIDNLITVSNFEWLAVLTTLKHRFKNSSRHTHWNLYGVWLQRHHISCIDLKAGLVLLTV